VNQLQRGATTTCTSPPLGRGREDLPQTRKKQTVTETQPRERNKRNNRGEGPTGKEKRGAVKKKQKTVWDPGQTEGWVGFRGHELKRTGGQKGRDKRSQRKIQRHSYKGGIKLKSSEKKWAASGKETKRKRGLGRAGAATKRRGSKPKNSQQKQTAKPESRPREKGSKRTGNGQQNPKEEKGERRCQLGTPRKKTDPFGPIQTPGRKEKRSEG